MKSVHNKPMQFEKLHQLMWQEFYKAGNKEYKEIYREHFNKELEF